MGKATSAALAGRARARQRVLAAGADEAERELRLNVAAAQAKRALSAMDTARERAALAIAAARATEHDEVAAAEELLRAAVRRAAAERLTVAQVTELVGMPAPGVRRILRSTAGPDQVPPADPAADGQQPAEPE